MIENCSFKVKTLWKLNLCSIWYAGSHFAIIHRWIPLGTHIYKISVSRQKQIWLAQYRSTPGQNTLVLIWRFAAVLGMIASKCRVMYRIWLWLIQEELYGVYAVSHIHQKINRICPEVCPRGIIACNSEVPRSHIQSPWKACVPGFDDRCLNDMMQ